VSSAGPALVLEGALLLFKWRSINQARLAAHGATETKNDVRDSLRRWSSLQVDWGCRIDRNCAGSSCDDSAPARARIIDDDFVLPLKRDAGANAFDGVPRQTERWLVAQKPGGL